VIFFIATWLLVTWLVAQVVSELIPAQKAMLGSLLVIALQLVFWTWVGSSPQPFSTPAYLKHWVVVDVVWISYFWWLIVYILQTFNLTVPRWLLPISWPVILIYLLIVGGGFAYRFLKAYFLSLDEVRDDYDQLL
jgi:hypothetical protein